MTGWLGQAMAGKRGLPKADIHALGRAAYWNTAATLLSHLHSSRPFRNEHGGMDAIFAAHLSFLFATID